MAATGCGEIRHPNRRATRPTIETMAHRHCLWSCKVCNYMKNKDHATYCEICGAVAPRTRFGIKVEGRHYLCYVKKALSHENDTLVMLDTCPAKGAMLKIHLSLDVSTPDLEERIARTLAAFRRHFNVIVWGENPDDDVVYDVEALTASQRMRVAERTLNAAELAAQAALEDAEQERPPSPQAMINGQLNGKSGIASLLAALASPYAEDGKEKKEEHKRPVNPASAGSTLFDKVVAECRSQVYDTVLGSFLPKDHPVVRAALDDPSGLAAHQMYGLESDFNFVKGMVKERDAMAQKVLTEAHLRRTLGAGSLLSALRPVEEEEQDRPRKLKVEVLYAESKLPRDFSVPCSLCERRYHPRNLVGLVPFRAVARWKEAHGMTLDPDDRRLRLDNVYEDSRLCVFCTQYFDTDFGEYFCYHRGKTECKDPVLLMEGNREGSNLDPLVSQQLQEFIKNPRPADNPFIRPYSRLSLGLNILQLRLRRDMPERMADVGCELARYSNLQYDLKKSRNTLALQLARKATVDPKKMTASGERLYGASLRLQAQRRKGGQGPVVFTATLRRSEKKAEEEMLATMDKPEWTVASTGAKKGKRALPSILAGNDAALPPAARGAKKVGSPSAAYDILLPKKASAKRVKLPPQQEGLMDIQLDDEEEADSDVRIVGRNGERRQQARPKGAERAPAYAEPDDWRAAEWQRQQQQQEQGDRLMDTQEYDSREKVRVGKVIIVKGHSYHDDNVKLAKKIYV